MKNYYFHDDFTLSGKWYIDKNDTSNFEYGNIVFESKKIQLKITGEIEITRANSEENSKFCINYLFGKLENNTLVTAYGLFETQNQQSSGDAGMSKRQVFFVSDLFFNCWVSGMPKYHSMYFRVPGLEQWVNRQHVNITHKPRIESLLVDTGKDHKSKIKAHFSSLLYECKSFFVNDILCKFPGFKSLKFSELDSIGGAARNEEISLTPSVKVNWGISPKIYLPAIESEIEFFLSYSAGSSSKNSDSISSNNFHFDSYVNLNIMPGVHQEYDWYKEQLRILKKFLLFVCGHEFNEANSTGRLEAESNDLQYQLSSGWSDYAEVRHRGDFFLSFDGIENELGEILNLWFESVQKLKVATDIGYGIMRDNKMWINLEFLSLMQILESFHRNFYGGLYLDQAEYDVKVMGMKTAIPDDFEQSHKDSLKSRIKYGNEYSLNTRMKELFNNFPLSLRKIIFGDRDKFPRKWIATRNYYTHWDESSDESVLSDEQLWRACDDLKKYVRALILLEMKISEKILVDAFSSYRR